MYALQPLFHSRDKSIAKLTHRHLDRPTPHCIPRVFRTPSHKRSHRSQNCLWPSKTCSPGRNDAPNLLLTSILQSLNKNPDLPGAVRGALGGVCLHREDHRRHRGARGRPQRVPGGDKLGLGHIETLDKTSSTKVAAKAYLTKPQHTQQK